MFMFSCKMWQRFLSWDVGSLAFKWEKDAEMKKNEDWSNETQQVLIIVNVLIFWNDIHTATRQPTLQWQRFGMFYADFSIINERCCCRLFTLLVTLGWHVKSNLKWTVARHWHLTFNELFHMHSNTAENVLNDMPLALFNTVKWCAACDRVMNGTMIDTRFRNACSRAHKYKHHY